jgi:dTDP-4-amino-4,6-dideoxygalactose transaminase
MAGRSYVQSFENEIVTWIGSRYALTTNGGTAALHCALAGLGVEAGDEVIVPAMSYIACAASVLHQQAIPVFADVDETTYNVTPETVAERITGRTRVIMAVHLHGLPADMTELRELADRHGIALLEDFSQAVGARYHGRLVGSLGDAGAASLMAGKNLPSAGEAGVVVTLDRHVRNRAATLKTFSEAIEADGSYAPLHTTVGYNYRANILSLVHASQQLFRLDEYTRIRQESAQLLDEVLRDFPGLTPPTVSPGRTHAYHMYRFAIDPAVTGLSITVDQAREGLRQVFWAEGLPLVEFQNVPLPGHALLQRRVGYGRGCPWSCQGRSDTVQPIEDFPGALAAIRGSLVIGYPARAALASGEVTDHYVRCFQKVRKNLRSFERFAAGLAAQPPWTEPARLF